MQKESMSKTTLYIYTSSAARELEGYRLGEQLMVVLKNGAGVGGGLFRVVPTQPRHRFGTS